MQSSKLPKVTDVLSTCWPAKIITYVQDREFVFFVGHVWPQKRSISAEITNKLLSFVAKGVNMPVCAQLT